VGDASGSDTGSGSGSGSGSATGFGEEAGITLERYAELGVALFGKEGAERDAVLRAAGLDAAQLNAANDAWMARMRREPAAALAYNDAYQRAMMAAGVHRPDVPFETYAQMLQEISGGTDTVEVCRRHGMDVQEFALLSQYWTQQLAANPELAMRLAAAMAPATPASGATPPPAPPTGLTII